MSLLQTYEYPRDHDFVKAGTRKAGLKIGCNLAVNCNPGDLVEHKWKEHPGLGMLVANGDDYITVLWSDEPQVTSGVEYVQQKLAAALKVPQEYLNPSGALKTEYNPMAVDEDFCIPCQPNERKSR